MKNDWNWNLGGDYIAHYGVSVANGAKVGSGRYRLGSGKDPFQKGDAAKVKSSFLTNARKRLYQKNDGSLTKLGKKKLTEYAYDIYGSVDSRYAKGKRKDARRAEEQAYDKKYADAIKKATGKDEWDGDGTEAAEEIGWNKSIRMWKDYVDKYSDASVKDLGVDNTDQVKDFLKNSVFKSEYDQIQDDIRPWGR